MDDRVQPAVLKTPLDILLGDLNLDPVEKAEKDAGISVKMKGKRYQSSVRTAQFFFLVTQFTFYRMPHC